jgi:hypothetical protein
MWGGGYTADYGGTAASNNDFSSLRYKGFKGFVLLPGAEFQAVGNAITGNFFTNSTRWAGTYKSSALRSTLSGLRSLLVFHISLKDGGNILKWKLCMNFIREYSIS